MREIIMWVMALGAAMGGLDRLLGNRLGLGRKFEEGFMLLGPTALSMAGIVCLTPLLSALLEGVCAPALRALGLDPAILGGLLAIDMGGYPIAMSLADDPAAGRFAGIVVAAVFGCTVTFTVPVGMGMMKDGARSDFARGVLCGLGAAPVGLVIGGALCGLGLGDLLYLLAPVALLSAAVMLGIWRRPEGSIRLFRGFAALLNGIITIGLMLGAVEYMTGFSVLPGMTPLSEAMQTVASIGIVMLGSLPIAELARRALGRPLSRLGGKLGMNDAAMAGLLLGAVSVMPMLASMKDMDRRGRIVNAAAAVSSASAISAHLGFTVSQSPEMLLPLLAAKLAGGAIGAAIALLLTRNENDNSPKE